jgi:hypothetical protein
MDPKTFVEWLYSEIDHLISEAVNNEIPLDQAQMTCSKAYDLIETMSVEERRLTDALLEGSFSKYRNVPIKYLEDHIEGILATVIGFLE